MEESAAAAFHPTSPCCSPVFFSVKQQKRKLRIYISNTYTPSKPEGEDSEKVASWELRVEGKLLEEVSAWPLRCFLRLSFQEFICSLRVRESTRPAKTSLLGCELAPEFGSDLATRCVFTAPFTPPHNFERAFPHTHTHTHSCTHTRVLF